ncbi:MAG: glycine cleavage system aminomethyltransferase GcvT [Planctomycetota bacterium]
MKKTALHDHHEALGARMVDFGGWHMPVQYASILDEAVAVRERVGLFDLGHMGRVRVTGRDAVALVDRVATNHCAKIPVGAIRYSLFCRENGFPIDDLLIYRDPEDVYLVVNAANTEADLAWLNEHRGNMDVEVVDETDATSMLAVQGPKALELMSLLVEGDALGDLKYYRSTFVDAFGIEGVRVSRTGYTGENGFELYLPRDEGPRVWDRLVTVGADLGLEPIGLGARDTLRLEAGMPLYGHEIDAEHDPITADLEFGIALTPEKGDFVGRTALEGMRAERTHKVVGLVSEGPRVPRQGQVVLDGRTAIGTIASGAKSPMLQKNIATAHVPLSHAEPGRELVVDFRGKPQTCRVVELPFYSRTRKKSS